MLAERGAVILDQVNGGVGVAAPELHALRQVSLGRRAPRRGRGPGRRRASACGVEAVAEDERVTLLSPARPRTSSKRSVSDQAGAVLLVLQTRLSSGVEVAGDDAHRVDVAVGELEGVEVAGATTR